MHSVAPKKCQVMFDNDISFFTWMKCAMYIDLYVCYKYYKWWLDDFGFYSLRKQTKMCLVMQQCGVLLCIGVWISRASFIYIIGVMYFMLNWHGGKRASRMSFEANIMRPSLVSKFIEHVNNIWDQHIYYVLMYHPDTIVALLKHNYISWWIHFRTDI